MQIHYLDASPSGGCRASVSHGVVTFTGHVAPKHPTLRQQSAAVLARYDEQLARFGLKKKDILCLNACVLDAPQAQEFMDALYEWTDAAHLPAVVVAGQSPDQSNPAGDTLRIELSLMAAREGAVQRYSDGRGVCGVGYGGMAYFSGFTCGGEDGTAAQLSSILERYDAVFARYGLSARRVVCANLYLADDVQYDELKPVWDAYFGGDAPACLRVFAAPGWDSQGRDPRVMLSLWVAADDEAPLERYDVQDGQSLFVAYRGMGYFSAQGVAAQGLSVSEQTEAVMKRYDALFQRFGVAHTAVINSFHRDIGTYAQYSSARGPWRQKFCCAGLSVHSAPVEAGTDLIVRYIVSLDGE